MTKLPQTIEVKVHSVTGMTETDLRNHPYAAIASGERATGLTSALILKGLAEAQLIAGKTVGNCMVEDQGYPTSKTKVAAENMRYLAHKLIDALGYRGFTIDVARTNCGQCDEPATFGIHIKFNPWTVATYDLRK